MNDHNWMMAKATLLYSKMEEYIGPQDLRRNRVQIAEALVGEWMEARSDK